MKEKNLLNRILQNTACPTGFWGADYPSRNEPFSRTFGRMGC